MKFRPNVEARSAWARRHGIDPMRILDRTYSARVTPEGLEYVLQEIDGDTPRIERDSWVTQDLVVVVPFDDPLPIRLMLAEDA